MLATIILMLGFVATKRRKKLKNLFPSKLSDRTASHVSTIYNLFACAVFLFPFVLFMYSAFSGKLDFLFLSYSILSMFFLLKFVDYQTLIKPKSIEANICSIFFLSASTLQLVILPFVFPFIPQNMIEPIGVTVLTFVLFTHGVWILTMRKSAGKDLADIHPKLYHEELPYRGLYNILGAYWFMGSSFISFIFNPQSINQQIMSVFAIISIYVLMAPIMLNFVRLQRRIKIIKTKRKYRKLYQKIKKDNWENEIVSKSVIAKILNNLIWLLLTLSIVIGVSLVYYFIFTGNSLFLIYAIFLFVSTFTTLHYRVSTRGERPFELTMLFKGKNLTTAKLKRLTNLSLVWYAISIGVLVGEIFFIATSEFKEKIFEIAGLEVTNLMLLVLFFVFSMIVLFASSIYLYLLPSRGTVNKRNIQVLSLLIILTGVTLIVIIDVMLIIILPVVFAAVFCSIGLIVLGYLFYKATQSYRTIEEG